jgi:hypothetical protein
MRMRWAGHVASNGERKCSYKALVKKLEGKKSPERSRLRWKNNINKEF